MKKASKIFTLLLIAIPCLILYACGTINVTGKTFRYDKVTIDWGTAEEEDKEALFDTYQVESESELLNVLKTKNNRNTRYTSFGTDNKYTTKNEENEVLDSGYYKQDDTVITLAETEEGLSEEGAFTLQANEKGYIVIVKLDDENKIFARYQYVEQE